MMDTPNDFLVGKEYWDLVGGKDAYEELLGLVDNAGKKFRSDIQNKIKEVAETKISNK
jgi:hypothetical protein